MADTAATEAPTKCDQCKKTSGPSKRCAKCKTTAYCNRECQAAHWKTHKRECAIIAQIRYPAGQSPGSEVPKRLDAKPFTSLYHNNSLHDRSEEKTFRILINVIRMRQEDVYNLEGDTMTGTIYNQEPTSEPAFRDFLRKAKTTPCFLPPW
ncbi:hypothetical protein LTR27_011489 [Elasticomyces elasticus]|nr:hypothetical protein LTR27_011489 [Elasticomyces elasticus]